jgi:hypothetical protein
MDALTNLIIKFYNSEMIAVGTTIFLSLTIGGVTLLVSAGNPEKMKNAKKGIIASFTGVILLLSAYLILRSINPELTVINIRSLTPINLTPTSAPSNTTKTPELFDKIKQISEGAKTAALWCENFGKKIQGLAQNCDCKNSLALCACNGGGKDSSCEAKKCYSKNDSQPCPEGQEIKTSQKTIAAWADEIIYYKNRAEAEAHDLREETSLVLTEKINYCQEKINTETNAGVVAEFQDQMARLQQEKDLKNELAQVLEEFITQAKSLNTPAKTMGSLPEQCFSNLETQCQAHCKGGCRDAKEGCQPVNCDGGNPCPINDMQTTLSEISNAKPGIDQSCEKMLQIINKIEDVKTITIENL